jgi:hypothetical protein
MNCIDCRYSLLKDGHYNCTYEEGECIKINVLEKENAELERKLEQTEKDLADYQFNYPTIKELQKENAELKAHHKSVCDTLTNTHRNLGEQLTKAKELIKMFSAFVNNEIEYDPEHPQEHTDLWNKLCEKAEQFLKEV